MEIGNKDEVKAAFNTVGFGKMFNLLYDQSIEQNRVEFDFFHQKNVENDRMIYIAEGRNVESKHTSYYNGFTAIIVNGLPEEFTHRGLKLSDLEARLEARPLPTDGVPYTPQEKEINRALAEDLLKLRDINEPIFLRLVALYNPEFPKDVAHDIADKVNEVARTAIRKQWFPHDSGLSIEDAYTLLKNPQIGMALLKTYANNGQEWVNLNYAGEKTKHDNYYFIRTDPKDYHPDAKLQTLDMQGFGIPSVRAEHIATMERGGSAKVIPSAQTGFEYLWMSANPGWDSVHLQSPDGKLQSHEQFLTAEARQAKEERHQQQNGQSNQHHRPRRFTNSGQYKQHGYQH